MAKVFHINPFQELPEGCVDFNSLPQSSIIDSQSLKVHLVDILQQRIYDAEVVINGKRIHSITPLETPLPGNAPYAMPGFVDSHIHIESTLLTPDNFAEMAVAQGVVGVVTDPHEIANVLGIEGINFMIESSRKVHFNFHFGVPSCVPSSPFETSGAVLDAEAVKNLLKRKEFYGLAEMMNYPGVLMHDPQVMEKLQACKNLGKITDGHCPGLKGLELKEYIYQGISTDHECSSIEEAREKISLGMKVLIREGSAACDFEALCPLLQEYPHQLMFCCDDLYPDAIPYQYINQSVKRALGNGMPFWNVLNAACLTPVEHYHLNQGLLREGDWADFILVNNLQEFSILSTFIKGKKVYDFETGCAALREGLPQPQVPAPNQFRISPIQPSAISVKCQGESIKVIGTQEGSLFTRKLESKPLVKDGKVVSDIENDTLKLVVLNRYNPSQPQVAFIKGFTLKRGALASTIAHDSHNIIALGCSDEEITLAINTLIECKGGLAVVDGNEVELLPLPVAGLMSTENGKTTGDLHKKLKQKAQEMGCRYEAPFMTMAFMALPVIPQLKLTDLGLFNSEEFSFTPLFNETNN